MNIAIQDILLLVFGIVLLQVILTTTNKLMNQGQTTAQLNEFRESSLSIRAMVKHPYDSSKKTAGIIIWLPQDIETIGLTCDGKNFLTFDIYTDKGVEQSSIRTSKSSKYNAKYYVTNLDLEKRIDIETDLCSNIVDFTIPDSFYVVDEQAKTYFKVNREIYDELEVESIYTDFS